MFQKPLGSDVSNTANNSEFVAVGKASSELPNRESMDQPEVNIFVGTRAEDRMWRQFGLALLPGVVSDSHTRLSNFSDALIFQTMDWSFRRLLIKSVEGPTLLEEY